MFCIVCLLVYFEDKTYFVDNEKLSVLNSFINRTLNIAWHLRAYKTCSADVNGERVVLRTHLGLSKKPLSSVQLK